MLLQGMVKMLQTVVSVMGLGCVVASDTFPQWAVRASGHEGGLMTQSQWPDSSMSALCDTTSKAAVRDWTGLSQSLTATSRNVPS